MPPQDDPYSPVQPDDPYAPAGKAGQAFTPWWQTATPRTETEALPTHGEGGTFDEPLPGETGYIAGVKRGAAGFRALPKQISQALSTPPQTEDERKFVARTPLRSQQTLLAAKRLLFDPQYEEWRKAWEEKPMPGDDQWNNPEERRNMHVLAAFVPLVGPMAAHLTELWLKGDKAGALGELTTLGMAAFAGGAAEGGLRTPLERPPVTDTGVPGRMGLLQRGGRALMGVHAGKAPKYVRETVEANRRAEAEAAQTTATRKAAFQEETKRVKTENEIATEQANAVNRQIQKEYGENISKTDYDNLKSELEARAKNADEAARYAADVEEAERLKQEAKDLESRRGELARDRQQQGSELADSVRTAERSAKSELNQAYRTIDERMGDASMPIEELGDTVKLAERTKLAGTMPENIRQFKSILNQAKASNLESKLLDDQALNLYSSEYDALSPERKATVDKVVAELMKDPARVQELAEQLGEEVPDKTISFRDLRGYVSEIDKILRERGGKGPNMLPGDIQQALKLVLNKARQMSLDLADQKGVKDLLTTTNARYKDYIETFHTPSGPSGSGSPIAKSLNAKDRAFMIKPLGNLETAERVRGMLERFAPEAVGLFDRFMQTGQELEEARKTKPPKIPTVKEPKPPVVAKVTEPGPIKPPVKPKLEEEPSPTAPKYRPVEAEVTRVGPDELRRLRGEAYDKQVAGFREAGKWLVPMLGYETVKALFSGEVLRAAGFVRDIPLYIMSRNAVVSMLERESVRNFIIKTTAEDLKPLNDLPPEYRTQAADRILHLMSMAPRVARVNTPALVMSPALQAFVYANASKPQQDRQKLMDQGRDLTATPFQQQQR